MIRRNFQIRYSNYKLKSSSIRFNEWTEAKAIPGQPNYYILRPETVESYFILWRLTKDQKYREWGWDVIQAIEKYCRSPGGYSGINNVYFENPQKDDVQQSFYIAEVLKVSCARFSALVTIRLIFYYYFMNVFSISICYIPMIRCFH